MVTTRSSIRTKTSNNAKSSSGGRHNIKSKDAIRRDTAKKGGKKKDGIARKQKQERKDKMDDDDNDDDDDDDDDDEVGKDDRVKRRDGRNSSDGIGSLGVMPPELIILILNEHSMDSLLNLNLTSRFFHTCCNPLIYEAVDLSIHNKRCRFGQEQRRKGARYKHKEWTVRDEAVLNKQRLFLRTMDERPPYAKLVKHLVWTFKTYAWKIRKPTGRFKITCNDIWDMFSNLSNVTRLDFCCLYWDWPFDDPPSRPLFPHATSVRLVGQLSSSMAQDLLHAGNLERARNLEIDFTTGLCWPGMDYQETFDMSSRQPYGHKSKVREHQTLTAYLLGVKSHCKSLQKMSIRTVDNSQFWLRPSGTQHK